MQTLHLAGYNVKYAANESAFLLKIAQQVPSILQAIKQEHQWLKQVVAEQEIDAVISDNRYGLHHPDIPCAIMTHQLQVLTGKGSIADGVIRSLHKSHLEKFSECWVVDIADAPGLSGKMGHPAKLPAHTRYLGLLSQAEKKSTENSKDLVVILSGPEPQRTILSQKLWQQAMQYEGRVVFVEGKADAPVPGNIPAHITHHQLLTKDTLQNALNSAQLVICRSGYSTLMDLVKLQKKAILIPTPGQTEQEYLGKELQQQGAFISLPQKTFDLQEALSQASSFPFKQLQFSGAFDIHKKVLDNWLETIGR